MNFAAIMRIATLVWLFSEVVLMLFTRRKCQSTITRDRGSRILLWGCIGAGIAGGTALQAVDITRIRLPAPWLLGLSLLLMVAGLVIRWSAILTLGRLFSTSVAIQPEHRLVRTGLYRLVRHPSYSGLLLLLLGLAFSFGNWLNFAIIVLPFLAALLYRIKVEEAALVEALGPDYVTYCKETKRLLPGLF